MLFSETATGLLACICKVGISLSLSLICCTAADPQQQDITTPVLLKIQEGQRLYDDGDLAGAIGRFRSAAELGPGLEETHVALGRALLASGDANGAEAEFNLAFAKDPKRADADVRFHLGKAAVYRKKKAFILAAHEYRQALRLVPKDAGAHNGLGVTYQEQGELSKAIQEFRQALNLDPDSLESRNNLGMALGLSGDLDGAIQQFQEVLKRDAASCPAHANLALAFERKAASSDEAVQEFRKAVECDPDNPQIRYRLGEALKRRGDLEGAITAYQDAIRLDSNFAGAYYGLGTALTKEGRAAEANAAFSRFHNERKKSAQGNGAEALVYQGVSLVKQGDLEGATGKFQAALEKDPNSCQAQYNLGVILAQKGDLEGAIGRFRLAVQADPESVDARMNLGAALHEKGNREEARREFEACLVINPNYTQCHYNLGLVSLEQGQLGAAAEELQKAADLKPDWKEAYYALAFAYKKKGDLDAAGKALERARRAGSTPAPITPAQNSR